MTDRATAATPMFPPFPMGMPLEAKERFEDYTRADGSSMEPKLPSAGEAGSEWQRHHVKVFGSDPAVTCTQLLKLVLAAESRKGSTLMSIPHWGSTDPTMLHSQWGTLLERLHDVRSDVVATTLAHVAQRTIQNELGPVTLRPAAGWQGNDGDLQEALADLEILTEAASEEEMPEPDVAAVANARILLPKLFRLLPVRYRVSPTERRGVAIDAPMRWGASVAVECAPDDTVYCFATIDGNSRRAKFYQMDGLPDVFIAKALRDLASG